MTPVQTPDELTGFLGRSTYVLAGEVVTVGRIVSALAVLLGGWLLARLFRRVAAGMFRARSEEERGWGAAAEPVVFWLTGIAALTLALDLLGVQARGVMNATLFSISGTPVTAATVVTVALIVAASWVVSRVTRTWVAGALASRAVDTGTQRMAKRLIHYAVMAIGLAIALDTLGVNLAALFAASAVVAIGLGFAMQNITQNFVSGLILLIERSIKPGDVLEVDGKLVIVETMGIRTTVARTRDEEEIIIPNAELVQNAVKNYTLRDSLYRVRVPVGVEYAADMRRVTEVLRAVGEATQWRFKGRDPVVLLKEFGDSSVNFELSVWTSDPWSSGRRRSELMEAVWWAVQEAGITIAFPQLDLHLDPGIQDAVARLSHRPDRTPGAPHPA